MHADFLDFDSCFVVPGFVIPGLRFLICSSWSMTPGPIFLACDSWLTDRGV